MLIPINEIRIVFEKISKKALEGGTTVVILCSYEVDSLCAVHILTGILKSDGINYKVIPVSGYTDLEKQFDKLKENKELRSLIFINNAGAIDLSSKWFAASETDIRAYVFDYHRPIHYRNIIMVDDGYFNVEECPVDEDFDISSGDDDLLAEEDDDDKENEVDDDEGEKEYGEDEDGNLMEIQMDKKEQKNPDTQDEDDLIEFGRKRRERNKLRRKHEKRFKLEKKQRIHNYYRGSYYGKSTAGIMYRIARQFNKENLDHLWYWIVGITDQLVHNRISFNQYGSFISECPDEVMRLGKSFGGTDENQDNEDEEEDQIRANRDDIEMPQPRKIRLETWNKKVGSILMENDLRLFLLRHWTLYDSMYYSNYIAARLSIWRERGRKELNTIITKIGIPLEEAKQQYKYMNNKLKKQLKDKLLDIVEQSEFNAADILILSFLRQIDPKTQISASDLTYAVSAILEAPRDLESAEEILDALINQNQKKKPEEKASLSKELSEALFLQPEKAEYNRIKNFWYAYEALSGNKEKLEKGIELAIETQRNIMNEATFLLDKSKLFACSEFRFCNLKSENVQEKLFNHPLTLQKLAILLLTFTQERKKNEVAKPFLVCMHNKKTKHYMIVGISPFGDNYISSTGDRNTFGAKFLQAAQRSNARIQGDNFESSICEIHEDDYDKFFEELAD